MKLSDQIKVMLAFDNGHRIEFRWRCDSKGSWVGVEKPAWNWQVYEYRVAQPKPVVVWRNKYGKPFAGVSGPYVTASHANNGADSNRTHLIKEIHYPIVDGIVVGLEDDCD